MKKESIIFILFVLACHIFQAHAQMNYWVLPPNKIDFTGTTPSASTLPGSPGTGGYYVSNGAFDENGHMLFYLKDESLFDGSGTPVGSFTIGAAFIMEEVAIVPVPGTCRDFYLIYKLSDLSTHDLLYSKISVSATGTVSIVSRDNLISYNAGSIPAGIAVSKLDGSVRYLYSVGPSSVERYTISSSGIGSMVPISSGGTYTHEVELNSDGTLLAWGNRSNNEVYVCNLADDNAITTYTISTSGSSRSVRGVEFSSDNSALYVSINASSSSGGIFKIDLSTGTNTRLTSGNNYANTQLETAKDGYIYAVNSGSLGKINQTTDVVSSAGLSGVTVYSGSFMVYTLPDQIDGEDYDYFFGVGPISYAGTTINSEPVSPVNPLMVCNASSINLNPVTSNATSYRVRIYHSDAIGSQNSEIGATPSWTASTPPGSINLKSLYSGYLSSNTGYYLVVLETQNQCKQASFAALVNVISYPPPTSHFTFTIGTTTNVTPNTTVPGNPSCQLNTNINGNSSSGFITYYQIDIDMVNCVNGTVLSNVGSFYSEDILDNDPSNINGIGIGAVAGNPLYFYSNPNNCYKVTYTVGNPCGSQSSTGYFTNVNFCRQAATAYELIDAGQVVVSPNPVKDRLTISFPVDQNQAVSLRVTDMHGNVYPILNNQHLPAGQHDQEFDMSGLPKGIYMYHLETDKITSGKIVRF